MRIDLNADVAESADDLALLDVVTSANVCCGAYAGGEELMLDACERAVERGVAIGAQVGYLDREGFGRRPQEPATDELVDELRAQIDLLAEVADAVGGRVAYVKPHGALYNTVVHDERQATAVVEAVGPYGLPLLGLPGAVSLRLAATEGLPTVAEGFADRAYTAAGTLVPRDQPGAVLGDVDEVVSQALRLAGQVDSLCVHGDSPDALALVRAVRAALAEAGHEVGPFV
ncbi:MULTISPECIES: 5-oxoprolinase subunit PxpA [unclassified Aeromicrobium]|uniref:LamB/YcsF family protein n=1 Tax=unclassified Aeromicrobium TaxID=2633570 RepID=UPI00288B2787|nr:MULTISPECIES: 5-oxoprolinase subunit PxpA [unclassified Aeromicrobium]